MGSYNLKVYEYADSVQLRLYNRAIVYSDKVQIPDLKEPTQKKEDCEDHECHERTAEQIEKSVYSSKSRTINQLYEISRANTWDYFLTFTFDRKKIDSSDYDLLCKKVSIWLSHLKQRYAPDLKYLIVPELHKDGIHYHFHGLLANTANIKFIDSGIRVKDRIIYNMDNWKYGFSTASKVSDSGRVSSYITKYITKDLCVVGKGKKRYWCSKNCDRAKIRCYNISYEDIERILSDNLHLLRHTSEVQIDSCGLEVTYIEMAKGVEL